MDGSYTLRLYRHLIRHHDLVDFRVAEEETDLFISARRDLSKPARASVRRHRRALQHYLTRDPLFRGAFVPHPLLPNPPEVVTRMAEGAKKAGVGPMAAVAGAIAELVGRDLLPFSPDLIVENGGDIFLSTTRPRRVAIFAGRSPFTYRLALEITPAETPLGICTSAGSVGPSFSFGRADAVVMVAPDTALADAAATAVGNLVRHPEDIPRALEKARSIPGLRGGVIIIGDKMGVFGQITLRPLAEMPPVTAQDDERKTQTEPKDRRQGEEEPKG